MATKTARTGTAPFAHLLALATGKRVTGKRAEDEDREDETGAEDDGNEPDDEDDKPEEGAETDDDKDGKKAKGAKRASGKKAESDDDDEEDEAKAESDEDDEEMAQARREGFAAAQARGRRIFGSASAALRPDMAAHLAFNDTMASSQAIAMLDMAASGSMPASGGRLARRMARVTLPNPGAAATGKRSEEQSFGDMAKAAGKKVGIFD